MKKKDESALVRLRPLRSEDAEQVLELLAQDREAVMCMARMPWPLDMKGVLEWIEGRAGSHWRNLAVLDRRTGQYLGGIGYGLGLDKDSGCGEVGYWIGRPFWNKGYATDALRQVLDLARIDGVECLKALLFPANEASVRVLEKCGFQYVESLEKDLPLRGGRRMLDVYELDLAPLALRRAPSEREEPRRTRKTREREE
ncbi:MAG: GNAT family N-acetyltransferase [Desulfovibrionaceae bacterium]